MMKDWENLRYFLAVAHKGTVSGAAKELGVSHSTVLRRVQQFEQTLDSKLFKKLQRGYELTTAGENLYVNAKAIEMKIDEALAHAKGHHDVVKGKLRISQPEIGILNLYPLYAEFQRQHPEITLEINSTMRALNISQQEVDVVLRLSESPPDLLVGRCLGSVKARAYASKRYLEKLPENYSINDYEWITWHTKNEGARARVKSWFQKNVVNPRIILRAETMPDVVSAVLSGMGVGFLSSHEARMHNSLVELFDGEIIAEHKLWILTHRDLKHSERVKTLMRFMAEHIELT